MVSPFGHNEKRNLNRKENFQNGKKEKALEKLCSGELKATVFTADENALFNAIMGGSK